MNTLTVPSDEDFARARAAMHERDRGLSDVRAAVLAQFSSVGLCEFFILFSQANSLFVAYLFFFDQIKLESAQRSGVIDRVKDAVLEQLEIVGRGERCNLNVSFEIDTDENVQRNFEGDYFSRLRQ